MQIDYKTLPIIACPVCSCDHFKIITHRFDSGQIVKCSNCRHIYLNPMLTNTILGEIYEGYHLTDNQDKLIKQIEEWFNDPKGQYKYSLNYVEQNGGFKNKNILEVGCGPGRFLFECKKMGAHVTGLDISPGAVQLAKLKYGLDLLPLTLNQALNSKSIQKKTFDIIFAFEIIEHVQNPVEFLKDIYDVLTIGGKFFISTPNFELYYLMGSSAPAVNQWTEHIHFFCYDNLNRILNQCGFTQISITSLNNLEYGDRIKHKMAKKSFVNNIWKILRKIRLFYYFKNLLFSALNKNKMKEDCLSLNGTTLLSIAMKE